MFVCICKSVTNRQVEALLDSGAVSSYADLRTSTGLGTQCGRCASYARERIREHTRMQPVRNQVLFRNAAAVA